MRRFASKTPRTGLLGALPVLLTLACRGPATTEAPANDAALGEAEDPLAIAVWPDEPFRATQPEPRPVPEVSIPAVKQFTLDNGLEVYLVEERRLPVFSMSLQFDVGSAGDPAGKAGRTSLCLDLLDEGTKELDNAAFEARQDEHAVSIFTSTGTETSTINARGLVEQLDVATSLLGELLRTPGLRPEDFDRLKDQRKANIDQRRASAAGAASRVFERKVWGDANPVGAPETGRSVEAVTLADCRQLVARLRPEGARLFVYGMLDEATIRAAFDDQLTGWKGRQRPDPATRPPQPATGEIYFVDIPGSAQSQIIVGYPGPRRDAPDYVATTVMAGILGGGFTSRLNMNLREDKGYAYGARGGFSYRREGSTFRASSSVQTDTTAPALVEIYGEMAGMQARPPTQDELDRERDAALLTLPALYATSSAALARFRSHVYFGLPLDTDERFQREVRALELTAVVEAAREHVFPDRATIVIAGDRAEVGHELEALVSRTGGGPLGAKRVVYVDADGNHR